MIEKTIADFFAEKGWTWKLKGGRVVVPSEQDILFALDEAARQLHNSPAGTILQVGRLTIEKKHKGHDVYMFVGDYL